MSDQHFDDFIKEKLNNHASPVAADMWDRISKQKKQKRVAGWWSNSRIFMIGLLAIAIAGGTYYFTYQPLQDNVPQNISHKVDAPATIYEHPSLNKNEILPSEKPSAQQDEPGLSAIAENNATEKTQATIKQQAENSIIQPSFATKEKENIGIHYPSAPAINANAGNTSSTGNLEESITFQPISTADFLATPENPLHLLQSQLRPIDQYKPTFHECPSAYGQSSSNWFVEVYGAPGYAFKSTRGNDEYLRRKDSTESFRSAFSAGIRLSKTLGENLVMKTGLHYAQINERFDFRNENERKTITVVTVRTIIRAPGDTLKVTDTSTIEQVGYRLKTTFNKYRSIDVPLIIGYEWGNDRFRTSINTGLIFNLQSWQEGDMLDTSYVPVAMNKTGSVFKKNIGLGIYAGVSLLKRIGHRTEIFAEPYFRYNLSNMTRENSPFNQRFHAAGINLGIRYQLNNRQH